MEHSSNWLWRPIARTCCVASGKVKPRIETYPLEKANEVRERLVAGKVRYRAVLTHR